MSFLQELFGSVHVVAQDVKPDPKEIMDSALASTTLDETMQQFIELPHDTTK